MKYLTMLACLMMVGVGSQVLADDFTLTDDAGQANITLPGITGGAAEGGTAGMNTLERNVDDGGAVYDQLDDINQHWWWLGSNGGAARPVHDFAAGATSGTLEFLGDGASGTPAASGNAVEFSYAGDGTRVTGTYQLDGGALGDWSTQLTQTLTVTNQTLDFQTYRLYSMSNLQLTEILNRPGSPRESIGGTDEMAEVTGTGEITQRDASLHLGFPVPMSQAVTSASSQSPADFNRDGFVGADDLTLLIEQWNTSPSSGNIADANGDGFVGADDLSALIENWNSNTPLSPTAVQVAYDPGNGAAGLIGAIEGGADLNGDDSANPAGDQTGEDISFAFQWTFTLAPGGSFTVTENRDIIPEPTSLALLGVGAVLIARRHRRARH